MTKMLRSVRSWSRPIGALATAVGPALPANPGPSEVQVKVVAVRGVVVGAEHRVKITA